MGNFRRKCPQPQHVQKEITHPKYISLSWPLKYCLFCSSANRKLWVLAAHFSFWVFLKTERVQILHYWFGWKQMSVSMTSTCIKLTSDKEMISHRSVFTSTKLILHTVVILFSKCMSIYTYSHTVCLYNESHSMLNVQCTVTWNTCNTKQQKNTKKHWI